MISKTINLRKHFGLSLGLAFGNAFLFGLSTYLPVGLAIPLCLFFAVVSIGCLVSAGFFVAHWFDENF